MKSNLFKYIFVIFAIGIIIYAIYSIYVRKQDEESQLTENEVEEAVQIKDLRLGISNYDTMNPLLSNNKEVLNIDTLIFEPLLKMTSDYSLEMCLATECSKISNTTYIIKIDNNKKWQDGSYLIAKDIQFTIQKLQEINSVYSYNVEKVESVEIIDSNTVRINLTEEVPFFEYNLTFPIVSNNYYLGEDFSISTKIPMGTGMYKIASIENGNILLTKNEKWWNIKNENAKIENINIKIYSQIGELYNSFKLGNIDIFTTSNYDLERYIGTIGYIKSEYGGRKFDYLAFNCENSILENVEVRKAIGYALNKNTIISSAFNNNYYVSNFPLDYDNYLYSSDNVSSGYNQEQSKKILQDNGWQYTNNKWQKKENYKTLKLNLKLTVCSEDTLRLAVAENIKEQLAQIGINININKVSNNQYQFILQNKNYEMILTGVYNSYSPNLETFFGDNNLQNYYNDEMKNILNEVRNISDKTLLKEKYKKIVDIYNEQLPFVSLYRNKETIIRSQKLSGELQPNNYTTYYRIYTWNRV